MCAVLSVSPSRSKSIMFSQEGGIGWKVRGTLTRLVGHGPRMPALCHTDLVASVDVLYSEKQKCLLKERSVCDLNQYHVSTEVRSEIFSSESKTQSSDRAMDLGLAEDHFSQPEVST